MPLRRCSFLCIHFFMERCLWYTQNHPIIIQIASAKYITIITQIINSWNVYEGGTGNYSARHLNIYKTTCPLTRLFTLSIKDIGMARTYDYWINRICIVTQRSQENLIEQLTDIPVDQQGLNWNISIWNDKFWNTLIYNEILH